MTHATALPIVDVFNVCQRVLVVSLARVLPFHKEISLIVKPSAFPSYCASSVIIRLVSRSVSNIHTYTVDQPAVFSAPLLPSTFILSQQYHRITLPDLAASLHWLLKEVTDLPLIPNLSQLSSLEFALCVLTMPNMTASTLHPSFLTKRSITTLCADFVAGFCRHGDKCKKSHEMCRILEAESYCEAPVLNCRPNMLSIQPRIRTDERSFTI